VDGRSGCQGRSEHRDERGPTTIAGTNLPVSGRDDVAVVKLDAKGNPVWATPITGSGAASLRIAATACESKSSSVSADDRHAHTPASILRDPVPILRPTSFGVHERGTRRWDSRLAPKCRTTFPTGLGA
jgi:hypothetical protein